MRVRSSGRCRLIAAPASSSAWTDGASEDYRAEPVPLVHHLIHALEERRIEQLDQHPELKVIALVRCRRKQQQVARMASKCLCEFVVLGLPDAASRFHRRQMMRFVEDDQIPLRRVENPLYPSRPL